MRVHHEVVLTTETFVASTTIALKVKCSIHIYIIYFRDK